MDYFGLNVKHLRLAKKLKTSEMFDSIGFTQSQWNNYERGVSFPKFEDLIKIAKYFGVTETELIHTDLSNGKVLENENTAENKANSKLNSKGIGKLNEQKDTTFTVVSEPETTYNSKKHNIYDLDSLAAAGVALFVADKDRRKAAPTLYLPWLGPGVHVRMGISGDSMHPTIKDGDKAIATWVDDLANLREGWVHIILDKEEGLQCKRIYRSAHKNTLEFVSDNDIYKPYNRHYADIIAIFRISEVHTTDLRPGMSEFQKELRALRSEFNDFRKLIGTK